MKNRILLLLLMIFTVFGFVACNGDITTPTTTTTTEGSSTTTTTTTDGSGTTTTTTIDTSVPFEQVGTPVNLSITGKVLSWDAVTGATGYAIYIGDTQTTTVTSTSFDFSANSATRIIFSVVALGGQGIADSQRSATLAYIANPATEIALLEVAMDATEEFSEMPEGFADELVNKGVLAADFTADYAALTAFQTAIEAAAGDIIQINAALSALLLVVDNYEAYIAALISILPLVLDDQIANCDYEIDYWQLEMDDPESFWSDEECQEEIDEYTTQKETLLSMKTYVQENAELLTVAATNVLDYMVELQSAVSVSLLTDIMDFAESEEMPTSAEIVALKNEIVNLLLDHIPSQEDVTMVYELLYLFQTEVTGEPAFGYASENAYATRLSMEFGLRFLLSLNVAFVDEVFNLIDTGRSETELGVEMGIHVMQAVNSFVDANEALITEMENVYTEAQREALFDNALAALPMIYESQGLPQEQIDLINEILDGFTYDLVVGTSGVFESQMEKLFDYLVLSDGELLRRIAIRSSIFEDMVYNYDTYTYDYFYINDYTGEEYENYTEYRIAQNIATAQIADEAVNALDATIATLTEGNVEAILDLVEVLIPISQMTNETFTEVEAAALIAAAKALIEAQDANLLGLLGDLTEYAKTEDVFGDLETLIGTLHTYQLAETADPDYMEDWEWDSVYNDRAQAIFGCAHITAFVTVARRTQIDAVVNAVFAFMRTAHFLEINSMTVEQVNDLEAQVESLISDFLTDAAVIAAYNYAALTPEQEAIVDAFMNGGFMPA
jgi:hypothetical protein